MSDDRRFSSWISYHDPVHGRVYRTAPDDTPESRAQLLEHLKRLETQRSTALPHSEGGSPVPTDAPPAPPPVAAMESPGPLPPLPGTLVTPTRTAGAATAAAGTARDPADGFTAHQGKQAEWLSDVIEKWHRHKVNSKAWKTPSTWTNAFEPDLRVFRELVASEQRISVPGAPPIWDLRMGDLDDSRIGNFIESFWQYPAQQGKRPGARDAKAILAQAQQAQQAKPRSAKCADTSGKREGGAQQAYNAKKRLGRIRAFLDWAAQLKYLSRDALVELEMTLKSGPKVDPDGGYRAFSSEELARIFGSAEYIGDAFPEAWQYFAPPMALGLGPRVREIADLTVNDFITVGGIPCIHFRGGDVVEHGPNGTTVVHKRVKTPGSERKLPIPQALIDLGLLDYVAARRAADEVWLWDGLNWEEKSGRGRYVTEWFGDYLQQLGLKEGRATVFHSFRSNLNQALTGLGFADSAIERILGHSPKTVRGRHYSKDAKKERTLPPAQARDMLNKIDWGITFHPSRKWGAKPSA